MHVLITGAAAGIGKATTEAFAHAGATALTLLDRDEVGLAALAETLPIPALKIACDLADTEELADVVARAEREHGPLEVLVNNAGVMWVESMAAMPWERALTMLKIDLLAPLRLASAALPGMVARGRGTVVNVTSMAGVTPLRGCTYYCAAKGGLALASEALRHELKTSGVNVVTVYPGPVETALERGARAALRQNPARDRIPTGKPDVLARRIVEGVLRRRARVIYPRAYAAARWLPSITGVVVGALAPEPVR